MNQLPDGLPTDVGQPQPLSDEAAALEARRLIIDAYRPTSFRDTSPVPVIGTAPPVAQPGIPPMSSKATDASVMMIAGGFLSLCLGAAASAVLYFSGTANETVVICICAAPPATFLALKTLVKGVKRVAPDEIHHHYSGTVHQDQRNVDHHNRWFGKSTTNM